MAFIGLERLTGEYVAKKVLDLYTETGMNKKYIGINTIMAHQILN